MSDFLGFIGLGIALALVFYGWPIFITINKYYGGKDDDNE